jgi:hypothetical protein
MYIAARSRRVNPAHARAAVAMAIEGASRVSEIIGRPVWVWSAVLSGDSGTLTWSTRYEHLDESIAANDALGGATEFADWVADNDGLFAGPMVDTVSEVLHGAPTGPPVAYVLVVRAVCANGSMAEAMGLGVEIAETSSRITGNQTMFVASVVGEFAGVGWLSSLPDLAALESGNAAFRASDDFVKLVDRAGHAFQPGITSSLLRRLN